MIKRIYLPTTTTRAQPQHTHEQRYYEAADAIYAIDEALHEGYKLFDKYEIQEAVGTTVVYILWAEDEYILTEAGEELVGGTEIEVPAVADDDFQSAEAAVVDEIIAAENTPPTVKEIYSRPESWVVLDTETTGLGDDAEICQIAIVNHLGSVLLYSLVKPTRPIPASATKIHGITNEMVADAPSFADLWTQIRNLLSNKTCFIYNAEYDTRLMVQSAKAHGGVPLYNGTRFEDVMVPFAEKRGEWNEYRQGWKWQKLSDAVNWLGYEPPKNAHDALADCRMTLIVMKGLWG